MAVWRYIKGTAEDFKGAPDWATHISKSSSRGQLAYEQNDRIVMSNMYQWVEDTLCNTYTESGGKLTIIAQRERVTSVNDDRLQSFIDKDGLHQCRCRQTPLKPEPDNVNHPPHYTQGGIECIDALRAATVGKSGIEAVCVANVIKYLWRYEVKGGVESIEKAQWYLNHLLEVKRGTQSD